ncbi:MAG: DUF4445 domain-containing protein [Alphaproteobacteria bacterium]|jgi:uncharacterized 2Fe-2S/4Fe-4S cluster protein (DUF4445 family)|nr:DUF4445 domain-containing protein [Alphaproteobacteria bacterium]MBT4084708.1 DUF4445 domain-containing protein [Alphaproteobacteria bacterium]MBT4544664.1 DUF4445 domain-containing protein [Alphaproteobacteria bacterium]MBT7744922.1 DUF4445 domain-containing protein [Alphaproteobacteria bacterium]
MPATDVLVAFSPSGRQGRVPHDTSLLEAARKLGVDLDSVCGGRGLCGRCQVEIGEGDFAKFGIHSSIKHITPDLAAEQKYAKQKDLKPGRRLACHARILDDIVVDVPPESQVHRQVIRKRAEVRSINLDPVLRLYAVDVPKPDIAVPSGDAERLIQSLDQIWGLHDLSIDPAVLSECASALRAGNWTVTVAVRDGTRIVGVRPGFTDRAFGLAIDIGSTTLAVHLVNLADGEVAATSSAMNPQIRFGEDLMSRVSWAMSNEQGGAEMTTAVRQTVDDLIGQAVADADILREDIYEAVIVCNPIMHHLFLGLDPGPLGVAPFALAVDGALRLPANHLDLDLATAAEAYFLPCIAGHVGADAAAMILSETPHERDEVTLLVDVGTNAELVLGNRQRLLAASSPTGPAFEGAQISCGQRAAPGAIERVRIDPDSLAPRFRIIGCDQWSDEPGFQEAMKSTGITGICGSGIIEAVAQMALCGIVSPDGAFQTGDDKNFVLWPGQPEIAITQADVRAVQLAKGALYAGAKLLMDLFGVEKVDRIVLAGAFGSHIDPVHAMALGMIPDCDPALVSTAGNAAGTGARIALLNATARTEIEAVVKRVEKIETAVAPSFQAWFVDALAIPHASDDYPELRKIMSMPLLKKSASRAKQRCREGSKNRTELQ